MDGVKYDEGKPRLGEMIVDFAIPMRELARVWEFGANKYEKSNWKKVDNASELDKINRLLNIKLKE